jgi:type IV secretory pathway VirJ component
MLVLLGPAAAAPAGSAAPQALPALAQATPAPAPAPAATPQTDTPRGGAPEPDTTQATAPQTNALQPGPPEASAPPTNAPQPDPAQTAAPNPNPAPPAGPRKHAKAGSTAKKPTPRTPQTQGTEGATHLPAGRFGKVTVYIPEGTPQSVAIFVSGDGGWNLGVVEMARALTNMGAVVIGVDIREYLGALGKAAQRPNAPCQLIAGDFENLSHQIQKEIGMFVYHVPVLIGYSSGATVVYATLVQSPPGTFAGALSMGFCPDQDFAGAALCPGAGLHYTPGKKHDLIFEPARTLKQPWIAFQGQKDQVCSPAAVDTFVAQTPGGEVIRLPLVGHGFGVERNWMPQFEEAYRKLTAHVETPPVRPPDIGDLPVNEVRADNSHADELAILLTGDGGWAGLDQELAARLAADGVPTVGLNSLKYFWTERTPDEAAQAVARIMRHYLAAWNKQRVLLVGYSFGADVLPFVVNRLPPDLRTRVATVNLLGVDSNASFEINIAAWVGSDDSGPPTRPEIATLGEVPVLCVYGAGETDSICPGLPQSPDHTRITLAQIGKGHHFSGEYATLAERILAFARGTPATT